jgi:MFS transporter, SP family, sugar:H+ symporter
VLILKEFPVVVGRWIAGVGAGALSLLVPMYHGENEYWQIREAMIRRLQPLFTFSDSNIPAEFTSRLLLLEYLFQTVLTSVQRSEPKLCPGVFPWASRSCGFSFLELVSSSQKVFAHDFRHNRVENAFKTMDKLYSVPGNYRVVVEELTGILVKHKEELLLQNQIWWKIFKTPCMAYRITIGVVLQALQQLTGANYFYYGTIIFKATGISNSDITQIIGENHFARTLCCW